MRILFLDCETTGLNPKVDRIVEIGASLYCSDSERLLRTISFITDDGTIKISPEISAINKITQEMLNNENTDFASVFSLLEDNFVARCDYLCAHNSPFDKAFIEAELSRAGYAIWERPWIDTAVDIPYPSSMQTRKLVHLASEHSFVNPFPHTALSDVLTMYRVFKSYPIADIIKRQGSPTILIRAEVDYANREKASKRGYRWNPVLKRWQKNIKAMELELEQSSSDFQISIEK